MFSAQNPWQSRLGSPKGTEGLGIGRSALANASCVAAVAAVAAVAGSIAGSIEVEPYSRDLALLLPRSSAMK